MSESTTQNLPTVPAAPTNTEIELIKTRGRAQVAYAREVAAIQKMVQGLDWGSGNSVVRNENASLALAQFCRITKANPQIHVDVLGGKPYLNAEYWKDRVSSDPLFYREEQREISAVSEEALRDRVARYRETAAGLDPSDQGRAMALSKALDLEIEADEIADARGLYRPPEWATHVYETVIVRFISAAPMEKIQAGEITDLEPWLREVRECNWAGGRSNTPGKKDPVGNAEPEKTARTRSYRRCATKAFPAWMSAYEEQIRKAETVMEGEFEIISSREYDGGEQAVLSSGEPARAESVEPKELPGTVEPAAPVETPDLVADEEWDRDDARKRYFATLRDYGITEGPARKKWQADMGLPESSNDFTRTDFTRAIEALISDERRKYLAGCEVMNVDPNDFALEHLTGKDGASGRLAEYLRDYIELNATLNALADGMPVEAAS